MSRKFLNTNRQSKLNLFSKSTDKTQLSDAQVAAEALHLELAFDRGLNLRDRIYTLSGVLESPAFTSFDAAMTELENESAEKDITIKLYSEGGSIYEAAAIVGRMKASPCPVTIEAYGGILSSATLILAAGDSRRISSMAWIMTHESAMDVDVTRTSQIKALAKQAQKEEVRWSQWMESLTGTSAKTWMSMGVGTDKYLTPEEAVNLGMADEIF